MAGWRIRCSLAAALCLAGAALARAPHEQPDISALALTAGLPEGAALKTYQLTEPAPAILSKTATAAPEHLAQERNASAHFSGRVFFAKGKETDARVSDTAITSSGDAPPEGWLRTENKLTHRDSGLECPQIIDLNDKTSASPRRLELKGVTQYDQRGRDVSCNYAIGGDVSVTLFASFYPDVSIEQHAAGAVAAMRQNYALKGVLPVTSVEISRKDENGEPLILDAALAGAFDIGEMNGVPYKTAIWLAKTHGWHLKARATYAQADSVAEVVAAVLFGANYSNIDMKNRANPTAAGAEV